MGTLKPQSNRYDNTVIGTLAVDGGLCEEGPELAAAPPSPLLAVSNVTAHPSSTNFILFHVAL